MGSQRSGCSVTRYKAPSWTILSVGRPATHSAMSAASCSQARNSPTGEIFTAPRAVPLIADHQVRHAARAVAVEAFRLFGLRPVGMRRHPGFAGQVGEGFLGRSGPCISDRYRSAIWDRKDKALSYFWYGKEKPSRGCAWKEGRQSPIDKAHPRETERDRAEGW